MTQRRNVGRIRGLLFFFFPLLANGNWPDIVFGFGLVSIFRYGLTMYFPEWISQYGSLRKPGMATLLLISLNPSKHDERKMSQYCQRIIPQGTFWGV